MWRPFLGPMERMKNTAKPPVNDHPKFKGLVVAYGRVIAYDKGNTRGIFLEEDRAQYIFKELRMQFLSHDMCTFMLSLKLHRILFVV